MAQPVSPPRAWSATALILAAGLLGGCGKNVQDEFPLSVGYQPMEPLVAAATFPPAAGNELYPEGLGPVVPGPQAGYYSSHARGYVHASLLRVYQALHDPAASYIHNDGGGTRLDIPAVFGEEPFPVSFRLRYSSPSPIGAQKFDVTYRAGPLEGTEAAPIAIGERYQKTWGTPYIDVMAGSLRATEVAPGITAVEMVAWLKAETQGQADCDGTVRDLYGDLLGVVAALP